VPQVLLLASKNNLIDLMTDVGYQWLDVSYRWVSQGLLTLRYHALWFPEHRMERMWLDVTPMEYLLIPIRLQL
jgi:hypothetical protein